MQAFVDRFKAKASKARQAQSRVKMIEKLGPVASVPIDERVVLQLSAARAACLADRDARRGLGRLWRRPAGAAQARPQARHGRPHRAARPERQRQVDLHPPAVGSPAAARGQGQAHAAPAHRLLLAGPGGEPRLRGDAVPAHEQRPGVRRRRDQGARPARPLRLLARSRRSQGRRTVGRREDAAAAVAGHAQRPSPAAARRADQPSRHGRARLPGRRHQRLRRRGRAGEPRHASGEDGRRPALGGRGRQGDAVRRRHRRLPGQAAARTQWRQRRQGRQRRASASARAQRDAAPAPVAAAEGSAQAVRRHAHQARAAQADAGDAGEEHRQAQQAARRHRGQAGGSRRAMAIPPSTSPTCSARRSAWSARSPTPSTSGWWRRKPTRPRKAIPPPPSRPSARSSGGSPSPGPH